MLRRRHALAAVAFGMLLLSACASDDVTQPSPTPSASAPVFASDEEAVEAAEAALDEYWRVSGEVFRAGGEGVEKLEPLVTEAGFADALVGVEEFESRDWVQLGEIGVDSTTFQSTFSDTGVVFLVVTTCTDYSEYSVQTLDGGQIELVDPRSRIPHEVTFEITDTQPPALLLSDYEEWPDQDC
jgi:hypothetical protein